MKTILALALLCAATLGQTAIAINGSVTVTGNPSVTTMPVAISGVVNGNDFKGTVSIGGDTARIEGTATVAADGTRYLTVKAKVGEKTVRVTLALGHPQVTTAGMVTVSGPSGYGQSGVLIGYP